VLSPPADFKWSPTDEKDAEPGEKPVMRYGSASSTWGATEVTREQSAWFVEREGAEDRSREGTAREVTAGTRRKASSRTTEVQPGSMRVEKTDEHPVVNVEELMPWVLRMVSRVDGRRTYAQRSRLGRRCRPENHEIPSCEIGIAGGCRECV